MSPELIAAVKERVERGHTNESIKVELLAAGYTEAVVAEVLSMVRGSVADSGTDVMASIPNPNIEAPSVTDSFSAGLSFAFKRWDLIGALLLGPLVMVVASYSLLEAGSGYAQTMMLFLVAMVWNLLAYCATIYIVTLSPDREVSFGEGLNWAFKNVWSFFWVSLLMVAVMCGGMILLVIPAFIVAILVGFAPYVYAKEGLKGMSAILRSRELVRGRWWAVFKQVLILMILIICLSIGVGILYGILSFAIPAGTNMGIIAALLQQIIMPIFVIVNMFVGMRIYRWLVVTRPDAYLPPPDKWKYTALAWLGILTVVLASLNDARQAGREVSIKQQMNQTKLEAEIYYNQNSYSYEGVCPTLEKIVTSEGFKNCIDYDDSWALAFTPRSESMQLPWCIDNNSDVGRSVLDIANVACASTPPNFENRADTKLRLQEFDTVTDY